MNFIEILGIHQSAQRGSKIPLFTMPAAAGYPLPAESEIDKEVDLNDFLVLHPAATFFAVMHGDFQSAGVRDGDIMIVDTSLQPEDGKLVIVSTDEELSLKLYRKQDEEIWLETHKNKFLPLSIEPYLYFSIVGVVTKVIHSL